MVNKGEIYHHFKGTDYEIVDIAKNSETLEDMVIYHPLDNPQHLWVRPLSMFMSKVDKTKYPDVQQENRFMKIS